MEKKKFLFVVNPQSGRGRGLAYGAKIQDWLELHGGDASVIFTSEDGPCSAYSLGKKAAQEGVDAIVGVGGDGTLNLLVSGMMSSGVPIEALPKFGIIRMGTGNNFAKNVGIPSSLFLNESMPIIFEGHTSYVDLGLMTDSDQGQKKYFLNVMSFGFDAQVVKKVSDLRESLSFLPKDLVYLITAGQEIISGFSSYCFELTGDGFSFKREACLLAVLNGSSYGGVFQIVPGADMSDGMFDVCVVDKVSKIRAVDILLRATKGNHVSLPEVNIFRTASLTVCSSGIVPREIDGEVMLPGRQCQISILPKALKVLVPSVLVPIEEPLAAKVNALGYQPA